MHRAKLHKLQRWRFEEHQRQAYKNWLHTQSGQKDDSPILTDYCKLRERVHLAGGFPYLPVQDTYKYLAVDLNHGALIPANRSRENRGAKSKKHRLSALHFLALWQHYHESTSLQTRLRCVFEAADAQVYVVVPTPSNSKFCVSEEPTELAQLRVLEALTTLKEHKNNLKFLLFCVLRQQYANNFTCLHHASEHEMDVKYQILTHLGVTTSPDFAIEKFAEATSSINSLLLFIKPDGVSVDEKIEQLKTFKSTAKTILQTLHDKDEVLWDKMVRKLKDGKSESILHTIRQKKAIRLLKLLSNGVNFKYQRHQWIDTPEYLPAIKRTLQTLKAASFDDLKKQFDEKLLSESSLRNFAINNAYKEAFELYTKNTMPLFREFVALGQAVQMQTIECTKSKPEQDAFLQLTETFLQTQRRAPSVFSKTTVRALLNLLESNLFDKNDKAGAGTGAGAAAGAGAGAGSSTGEEAAALPTSKDVSVTFMTHTSQKGDFILKVKASKTVKPKVLLFAGYQQAVVVPGNVSKLVLRETLDSDTIVTPLKVWTTPRAQFLLLKSAEGTQVVPTLYACNDNGISELQTTSATEPVALREPRAVGDTSDLWVVNHDTLHAARATAPTDNAYIKLVDAMEPLVAAPTSVLSPCGARGATVFPVSLPWVRHDDDYENDDEDELQIGGLKAALPHLKQRVVTEAVPRDIQDLEYVGSPLVLFVPKVGPEVQQRISASQLDRVKKDARSDATTEAVASAFAAAWLQDFLEVAADTGFEQEQIDPPGAFDWGQLSHMMEEHSPPNKLTPTTFVLKTNLGVAGSPMQIYLSHQLTQTLLRLATDSFATRNPVFVGAVVHQLERSPPEPPPVCKWMACVCRTAVGLPICTPLWNPRAPWAANATDLETVVVGICLLLAGCNNADNQGREPGVPNEPTQDPPSAAFLAMQASVENALQAPLSVFDVVELLGTGGSIVARAARGEVSVEVVQRFMTGIVTCEDRTVAFDEEFRTLAAIAMLPWETLVASEEVFSGVCSITGTAPRPVMRVPIFSKRPVDCLQWIGDALKAACFDEDRAWCKTPEKLSVVLTGEIAVRGVFTLARNIPGSWDLFTDTSTDSSASELYQEQAKEARQQLLKDTAEENWPKWVDRLTSRRTDSWPGPAGKHFLHQVVALAGVLHAAFEITQSDALLGPWFSCALYIAKTRKPGGCNPAPELRASTPGCIFTAKVELKPQGHWFEQGTLVAFTPEPEGFKLPGLCKWIPTSAQMQALTLVCVSGSLKTNESDGTVSLCLNPQSLNPLTGTLEPFKFNLSGSANVLLQWVQQFVDRGVFLRAENAAGTFSYVVELQKDGSASASKVGICKFESNTAKALMAVNKYPCVTVPPLLKWLLNSNLGITETIVNAATPWLVVKPPSTPTAEAFTILGKGPDTMHFNAVMAFWSADGVTMDSFGDKTLSQNYVDEIKVGPIIKSTKVFAGWLVLAPVLLTIKAGLTAVRDLLHSISESDENTKNAVFKTVVRIAMRSFSARAAFDFSDVETLRDQFPLLGEFSDAVCDLFAACKSNTLQHSRVLIEMCLKELTPDNILLGAIGKCSNITIKTTGSKVPKISNVPESARVLFSNPEIKKYISENWRSESKSDPEPAPEPDLEYADTHESPPPQHITEPYVDPISPRSKTGHKSDSENSSVVSNSSTDDDEEEDDDDVEDESSEDETDNEEEEKEAAVADEEEEGEAEQVEEAKEDENIESVKNIKLALRHLNEVTWELLAKAVRPPTATLLLFTFRAANSVKVDPTPRESVKPTELYLQTDASNIFKKFKARTVKISDGAQQNRVRLLLRAGAVFDSTPPETETAPAPTPTPTP